MLKFSGVYNEIEEAVRILERDYELSSDIEINVEKNSENKLVVTVRNGVNTISYCKKADFFRGLMILKNAVEKGERDFVSEEERKLRTNGVMLRFCPSLKCEVIKDHIRLMAQMGLDSLYAYMEDIYEMKKYPYFGYMRGRYTEEELKDLDSFAQKFGVDIVPTIQTLGHLEKTLRWRYSIPMRDTGDSLYVGKDETYELIDEMIKVCRNCFSSKRIHVGMDEAYGMGKGAYLSDHGLQNVYDIFTSHLIKVNEICLKYDFTPMIWSDMYFTLGSETGTQYDPLCKLPEDIQETVPKEMGMVYWDYFIEDGALYDTMFARHREIGREIVFAGGVWRWSSPIVNYSRTWRISKPALEACYRNGVKDVFITVWGGACDANAYETILSFQLFAEYTYQEKVDDAKVWEMFRICTGLDPDAFWALDCDDLYGHKTIDKLDPIWKSIQLSQQLLYQETLYGIFDDNYKEIDIDKMYSDALERINKLSHQGRFEYMFDFHRKLLSVLLRKGTLGRKLYSAYQKNDSEELARLKDVATSLVPDIRELYELHRERWLRNYKPFGMEALFARYGKLMLSLETVAQRVGDYLDGKVDSIPELEEERLRYNTLVVNHEEDICYEDDYNSIAFI